MNHIVIFRTSGSYIDYNTYNCQELGLSKALVRKGYKVSLVMGGPEEKKLCLNCGDKSIDIYYLTYQGINQSLCIFNGWKCLLKKLNPSVVQIHEFGMYMSYKVSVWAKNTGVKCVLIQGNYNTTQKPLLKQLECLFNYTFGTEVLRNVQAIGCKTKAAVNYVASYSNKTSILTPVGLDESKFENCLLNSDFRSRYGLDRKKVLLYVGKMEPRRNPLFLLELMRNMPKEYNLVLIGDGPLMNEMNTFIKQHQMENVIMLGKKKQEELPAIYTSSDLFMLASNYEIFGMVILEAMYFGLPVISSSTAGSETLMSKEDGIIFPDYNIERWKNTIIGICSDKERLDGMKKMCRKKIRNSYVWDKAVEKFMMVYDL